MDVRADGTFHKTYSHIGCKNAIKQLQLRQIESALQLIIVEWDFSWSGAVHPGLHKRGPRVLQEEAAADVVLADPPDAGKHRPPAVVLHRVFSEEEVGEVGDVVGGDEVWLCWKRDNRGGGK